MRRALFGITVRHRHTHRALARLQLEQLHIMPTFLHFLFHQGYPRIIRSGRDVMARVVAMPTYTWACLIVVVAGTEILERAHEFAVEWAAKCVSISIHFDVADVL